MTREEAIKELKGYEDGIDLEYAIPFDKAILYAIQALSQEPTVTSTDEPMTMVYPTIVCDDAISRQAAMNIVKDMRGLARADVLSDAIKQLKELPSVTLNVSWIENSKGERVALNKVGVDKAVKILEILRE